MGANLTVLDLTEAKASIPARKPSVSVAKRTFAAAQMNRFTFDWAVSILSRDQKLWQDLRKLRARSRELADNDPLAAKFLSLCVANIAGPKGITMQSKVKMLRGPQLAAALNEQIEQEWKSWGRLGNCTVDGTMSFSDLERLFVRTVAMDGEFLCILKAADNPWGFAVQVVDVDQLDTNYSVPPARGQNEVRMGVEVDKNRKPVAYWLWTQHPNEWSASDRTRVRVPAEVVIHCFLPDSARQTRGLPWMTPAMYQMNMLKGYEEAAITAARVAACQSFAITVKDSGADDAFEGDGENLDGSTALELTPGGGIRLGPGEDIKSIAPEHPSTNYGQFVKECKRNIATALSVSYTSLADDLEGVNFSSIRAGLLNERDMWRVRQKFAITQFHRRISRAWLSAAVLSGRVDLSVRDEDEVADCIHWHPRGWDWVDPKNDQNANVLAVENGFTTRTRILAERGYDLEETLTELAEEEKLIERLGLKLGTDTTGKADTASDDQKDDGAQGQDDKSKE
ncbi:phage portal protein [Edaphobacter albus]|uniref:phage portal protein n=1 Tax=Edaphobacter sp. 4G125 TaxID=2763071 RepID=UPI001645DA39|nr:phage portal protein [Edaphobacter sp. 4G125]QNI37517.1 phage portal protein [Edaphobacter sp. 4G125]